MAENFSNLAKKTDSWVQEADGSPIQGEIKETYTKTLYIKVSKVKDALKMKVTQSCPTLSGPMGYTVHGILQARIPEWVAFPFSGDLPNPGIEPQFPTLQVDSLPAEPEGQPFCILGYTKITQ